MIGAMGWTQFIAYWVIGLTFCCAWGYALVSMCRAGWCRSMPWFAVWLVAEAIQSAAMLTAGRFPSDAWWLHVWMPVEAAVLVSLAGAVAEMTASFASVGVIVTGAALCVAGAHGGRGPIWFRYFQTFRSWFWVLAAIALTLWLLLLAVLPRRPSICYRAAWLLALHLWLHALVAPVVAASSLRWLSAQTVFRVLTILVCWRWSAVFRRFPYSVSGGPMGGFGGGGGGPSRGTISVGANAAMRASST